jgi:dipeptidyl aminopeptidase/acylaminoacyl peptidase
LALIGVLGFDVVFSSTAEADESKDIHFLTGDGIRIAASVSIPDSESNELAAVIFIHQGGSSREEWTSLPIFRQITEQGMYALAYDVRGHGESAGEANFSTLFDDPQQAPQDMAAAIDWLRQTGRVDMSRVAVVGASIGANLACVAVGSPDFKIKTAVAMSGKVSAVYNLAGGRERLSNLHSLFLIASELEQDGKRAAWASELYELTNGPRQLEIVGGSSGHGVSVFDDDPELQQRILEWLLRTL